jgi:hypothetical protein
MTPLKTLCCLLLFISFLSCSTNTKKEVILKKKEKEVVKVTQRELPSDSSQTKNEDQPQLIKKQKVLRKEKAVKAEKSPEIINTKDKKFKIPSKWENAFSTNAEWMALYTESKTAFLTGWTNEFSSNPKSKISVSELLYAYRRRMEKAFFQSPEFMEFCIQRLAEDSDFQNFKLAHSAQVNAD